MITYTVSAESMYDDEIFVDGITDAADAEETAEEMAKDYPDRNVFIAFNNTEDPNNFGYLNRDGHNPTGKAW